MDIAAILDEAIYLEEQGRLTEALLRFERARHAAGFAPHEFAVTERA